MTGRAYGGDDGRAGSTDDDLPFVVDDDGVTMRGAFFARVAARAVPWRGETAVALQAPTSTALLLELLAARAAGAVPVLLSPRWPAAVAREASARVGAGLRVLDADARAGLADVGFTSGTTGAPRAVAHTRQGHDDVARAGNAHLPFGPGQRWLVSLPLVHVGGLGIVARALCGGGALAIPRAGEPIVDAALRLGATHLSLVRAQLVDLLRSPRFDDVVRRLAVVLVGGGPAPAALLDEAVRRGLPVAQTWGMTETHAQVATSLLGEPATCGQPLRGRMVRVDDDGVLGVRGVGLSAGFVDERGLSPLPVDADGFFVTGDRGHLDAQGRVVVTGRAGLRLVSGGEKIEPEAIEGAILSCVDVDDAVVVPVEHPRWGQRPVAFVRARTWAPSVWLDAVRATLPKTWVPDAVWPWPDDVEGGKAARALLRARAAAASPSTT
ncbi:MAG: AMP-binding protein [Deltaproteobacteria bacterium]|nr:AMP-binding protein [Deltaproteobacteria bacterium]